MSRMGHSHVATNLPCIVCGDVTIGHGAIVMGARSKSMPHRMGAIIHNGATLARKCPRGRSFVTEGRRFLPAPVLGAPRG